MAHFDFLLFPKLRETLEVTKLNDKETEHNIMEQLLVIIKNDFERCLQHWQEQWNKCVCTEGACFEGD